MTEKRDNIISFRLTDSGQTAIEKLVIQSGVDRTTVIRTMLAIAQTHERELMSQLRLIAASQSGTPNQEKHG